jgi:putative two-component system response regulator
LDAVKLVHPGLILLDIRLPDIDGVEVCRRLKADLETAGIRVIFVTSLSETSIGLEGFEAGAVDFITKPIMPELVIARVKSHLSLVQVDRLKSAYNDAISMLAIADSTMTARPVSISGVWLLSLLAWPGMQVGAQTG